MIADRADIVWLASYPKSGNTWFRILLANLRAGGSSPADINALGETSAPSASARTSFEDSVMLESGLLTHAEVDCLRSSVYDDIASKTRERLWFKVHDAYTTTRAGQPIFGAGAVRAAVYLVRDPRDVAVSFASHSGQSLDEIVETLNSPDSALCAGRGSLAAQLRQKLKDWSGHVTSWLDQSNVSVHLLRYEDLTRDTEKHFDAALQFVGASTSRENIARAVRQSDFSRLQRQEIERGFVERMSRTAPFFRAGKVGQWREVLTGRQARAIIDRHAKVMQRLGYL